MHSNPEQHLFQKFLTQLLSIVVLERYRALVRQPASMKKLGWLRNLPLGCAYMQNASPMGLNRPNHEIRREPSAAVFFAPRRGNSAASGALSSFQTRASKSSDWDSGRMFLQS